MAKTLPEAFRKRMAAQLGAEYDDFISAYELPPVRGLRINTLKISKERFSELCPWKTEQASTLDEGLILLEDVPHIGSHPYHIAGLFYVQEPSAMSVIEAAQIEPGMRVLDLCAAPGGKSGGIAARLNGGGFLLANEIVPSRAKQLARNLERLGVVNAAVTSAHPDSIAEALPRCFARVIVDAPCSGEGMFRKDDTAIAEWSPEHAASCALRQKAILESAEKCLAPGGKLVYSTCTFSPEENEGVIDFFLERHAEYSLESMHRLYPHTVKGEGHFVAVLSKHGDSAGVYRKEQMLAGSVKAAKKSPSVRPLDKKNWQLIETFFSEALIAHAPDVSQLRAAASGRDRSASRLTYCPFDFPEALLSLPIVSLGVEVGECVRDRIKPSHSFFMAAHGLNYRNRIELSPACRELAAFLRGETLEFSGEFDHCGEYSRYMPVCIHGFPVGFGKLSDGVIKNHLPKGLVSQSFGGAFDE